MLPVGPYARLGVSEPRAGAEGFPSGNRLVLLAREHQARPGRRVLADARAGAGLDPVGVPHGRRRGDVPGAEDEKVERREFSKTIFENVRIRDSRRAEGTWNRLAGFPRFGLVRRDPARDGVSVRGLRQERQQKRDGGALRETDHARERASLVPRAFQRCQSRVPALERGTAVSPPTPHAQRIAGTRGEFQRRVQEHNLDIRARRAQLLDVRLESARENLRVLPGRRREASAVVGTRTPRIDERRGGSEGCWDLGARLDGTGDRVT